ncbi:hypothetical protein LNKW23_11220 [Paralimibaculum aggregatum]|uniref:GAF domain-containing protein n=2 Tax=Paralimibaculum aggregatum TaxID=3036245 RepID=A0ABQ6LIC9_9RHOB|nr:hypothetical protein LNKW23_11220 [Limibaculum sp. NKW23]
MNEAAERLRPDWPALAARIAALTENEHDEIACMATVACELFHGVEGFDWVGFYRVTEPELLRIGPYQGGHGCLVIPFERGVCGAAAREGQTLIVPDVEAFPGHIACAASTRSEIVVPVRDHEGRLIGVLDIDSDLPDRFDAADAAALETMVSDVFARPPPAEPEREGLRRVIFEDDVFYGPVLLGLHLALALLSWPVESVIEAPGASVPELIACTVQAVTMMIPVFLIIRAYFHGKVDPLPTVLFMLGHAGLMIVGYAGIYSMLEYGPGGGLVEGADNLTSCVPGGMTDFYFSAITFSTVGYGDCVPYGPARVFAMLQGLLSYFFVGITLGLMTSVAPTERQPKED